MIRQPVTPELRDDVKVLTDCLRITRDHTMGRALSLLSFAPSQYPNVALPVDETEAADAEAHLALHTHAVICHLENSIREGR